MPFQTVQSSTVERQGIDIYIYSLNHVRSVSEFIRSIRSGIEQGYQEFSIHWAGQSAAVFPNACVPIASAIEHFKKNGIDFYYDIDPSDYLSKCNFSAPQYYTNDEITLLTSPFDQIIKYNNSSQVAAFTQRCVDSISHQTVCEDGILESLIWCINEVMDNVLVHSNSNFGYVLAQFHSNSKHIALCISDTGIGIFNSLKRGSHRPKRAIDALTLSIQEGIGDGQGQGNGLFGLNQIVKSNGGRLTLTSGPASIMVVGNDAIKKYDYLPYIDQLYQGTNVDFQLDLNKKVDLKTAFSSIGGFDGFDIRIDDMLQENDTILYDVFKHCEGTATREAGRLLRNDILNTLRRSRKRIILDFSNIVTVSSSFIDELVAKLIIEMGIISFNQMIMLGGVNETVKYLCERSIYMRIFDEWKAKG